MRNFILTLLTICSSSISFGQSWVDFGIKGSWGTDFYYNQNILDDVDYNHLITTGNAFGAKLGWNFDDSHELTFDFLARNFNQQFRYSIDDTINGGAPEYNLIYKMKAFDFALLYRNNKMGRYLEIGPQYSLLRNAHASNEGLSMEMTDVTELYQNYFSVVAGFGAYVMGTENFGVTIGGRLNFGVSDLLNAKGQSINFPTYKDYNQYKGTFPVSLHVVVEANYDFAFMARAKCSNKKKMILF